MATQVPSPETPPRHWITLVRDRLSPGWEEPEPEEPQAHVFHCGGNVEIERGQPLPEPKACTWCGRKVRAEIVQRWEARSFREFIFGPGEHYPKQLGDKPYKTPIQVRVVGYPCICMERPPYTHWIVSIALKKGAGWDPVGVNT